MYMNTLGSLEHVIKHFNNINSQNLFFEELSMLKSSNDMGNLASNLNNLHILKKILVEENPKKVSLQEKITNSKIQQKLKENGFVVESLSFVKKNLAKNFKNSKILKDFLYTSKNQIKTISLKKQIATLLNQNFFLAGLNKQVNLCDCYGNCHGDCHSNCHGDCKAAW